MARFTNFFVVVQDRVRSRAPLRLGLAGGGTDVSPYAELHGGAVMNATIDRYIFASVELIAGQEVEFESHDLGLRRSVPATPSLALKGVLDLHAATYNRIVADYLGSRAMPLRLTTRSEAPAGSGLGSSSTLVVAMVQAMVELFHSPLGEYDIAHLAWVIERQDLGLAGGQQDQYAAAFGGFNFMEFRGRDNVIVNPLRIRQDVITELQSRTLICFTGTPRAIPAWLSLPRFRACALNNGHRISVFCGPATQRRNWRAACLPGWSASGSRRHHLA
jgi:D-glycero-alpha-D-manno-heptose-7-phosphate kinase